MKKRGSVLPGLVGLLGALTLVVTLGAASTAAQATPKKAQSVSPTITIRGVLLKTDKTPLASDLLGGGLVLVTAAPVTGEAEEEVSFELTDESVEKNTTQPDAKGRFNIKIARNSTESKKLEAISKPSVRRS